MLVAEPVDTRSQSSYPCLDLLYVSFDGRLSQRIEEHAVLLEVSEKGGLLQSDEPVPSGSSFSLFYRGQSVPARVASCREDDYGYLLEFTVDNSVDWFPSGYQPPYLLPEPAPEA